MRGKTTIRRLTAEQAAECAVWISNYRKLRSIVSRIVALSLKETDRILRKGF